MPKESKSRGAKLPAGKGVKVPRTVRRHAAKAQTLHDFVHDADRAALADKLLALADRYADVAMELAQWQRLSAPKVTAVDFESAITDLLTPERGFIKWNESYAFVSRAEAVLPLLQQLRAKDASAAVPLGQHALRKSWDVLAQADDSGGDIGGLCQAIGAEWVKSLKSAKSQSAVFAEGYLALQLDDPFGCFDSVAAETAMGAAARARYQELLASRWRTAKDAVLASKARRATSPAKRGNLAALRTLDETDDQLWTLERLYLAQLKCMGKIDTALAVLREDLSSANDHSQVIRLLEEHKRFDEAFTQTRQACLAFAGDTALEEALLRCFARGRLTSEALALRRKQFDRGPSVETYGLVLKAGKEAKEDPQTLRQTLLDHLQVRENDISAKLLQTHGRSARLDGRHAPDVTVRAQILGSEKRWLEAFDLVSTSGMDCRSDVLQSIALHLPAGHHEQAITILMQVLTQLMSHASSPYGEELALVKEITKRMGAEQQSQWLGELRSQYRAKRNFVRDLPAGRTR